MEQAKKEYDMGHWKREIQPQNPTILGKSKRQLVQNEDQRNMRDFLRKIKVATIPDMSEHLQGHLMKC